MDTKISSGTSVIKTAPSLDLLGDLRKFVAGATRGIKSNPLDLARTALSLLKTLPAARDAVLEYFCTLFDVAVSKYVMQIEADMRMGSSTTSAGYEEATIAEIHNVLCEFVSSNPKAWAPIISTWSLELLGELSSRYAGRAHVPLSAGLNETLQLWMSCRATRTLIDITTQCLSCLMHSDTEACINALLDTSVAHSPHFDWVVAHVGSCFPHTVITRVLSCGLKDFSQHGSADQSAKAPKLNSVVGILGHLAGSHFGDIRTALLELFKSSLEIDHEEGENSEYAATVPYLLQLASLSPTLLRALTTDVLHTFSSVLVTPNMLPKLTILAPDWCTYFGGSQALEDLIVHLARSCEQGGTQILKILLDAARPDDTLMVPIDASVRATSREILELLLQEIDNLLRSAMKNNSIPLLESIKKEMNAIQPLLLSRHMLHVQTAVRLLGLLGHQSMCVLVSSAAFLLQRATTDEHLAALVKLVTINVSNALPLSQLEQETGNQHKLSCLAQALEQAIRSNTCCMNDDMDNQPPPEQLWLNIARLLRWEQSGKVPVLRGNLISSAVRSNLKEASHLLFMLTDASLAHAVAAALDLAIVPPNNTNIVFMSSVQLMLLLAKAIVAYFFLCVSEKDPIQRLRGVRLCCRLLSHLSTQSPPARALALRELLEGSLFHEHAHLFGARHSNQIAIPDKELRLLIENHKQGTSAMLAQRHSSVFHAGVIGYGPRRAISAKPQHSDAIMHRTQLLVDVIKACCAANTQGAEPGTQEQLLSQPVSLEAITSVSLLLVELISPDVMYNGLPWPEEDFCKVTVERDLYIRRLFDDLPLAWHLMTLVATYRPALCYCSVLLRALTATLLAQWGSAAQQTHNGKLLATTAQVLELMALGQLLPPPLSSLRDIIPHLKAQEVVQLLRDCVWNYMRDHVPSPALFTRDENGLMWRDATQAYPGPQYTDTLRITMQNNIKYLGSLYCQLFPTKQQ